MWIEKDVEEELKAHDKKIKDLLVSKKIDL